MWKRQQDFRGLPASLVPGFSERHVTEQGIWPPLLEHIVLSTHTATCTIHPRPPHAYTSKPPNRKKPCISNRVNKHSSYRDDRPLPRCEWWTRRSRKKQVAMLVEDPLWQPQGTHPLAGMGRRKRAQWPFPDTRADEEAGAAVGRRWDGSAQGQLELKISNDL